MASTDTILGDHDIVAPASEEEDPPLRKPDWREGLDVMPHHFQAQDRYAEQLIDFSLGFACDRPWGLTELAVDRDALATANRFALERLRGIFPDGTPVVVGRGGNALVPARSLDTHLRGRSTLAVYVGIAPEAIGRGAVTEQRSGLPPRFTEASATVVDANTGERPIAVPWLRPNVVVLFEGERLDEYIILPVARLRRAPSGRVELDPKFVPPVLRVLASGALEETLRALETSLTGTYSALVDGRSGSADGGPSEANRFLLTVLLGRALPRVRFLLGEADVHPREAYQILAEVVGALSPIAPSGRAQIPAYDYLDLGGVFDALVTEANDLLDALSAAKYRAVHVRHPKEGHWIAELKEPGAFAKDVELLLIIRAADPAQLRAHGTRVLKVATPDELDALAGAAIPGVEVVPEPRRPPGLGVPERAIVFRVVRRGPHWEGVVRRGSIAVYAPPGFVEDVTVYLEQRGVLG